MEFTFTEYLRHNAEARSIVSLVEDPDGRLWVKKNAPKTQIDNEVYALSMLQDSGYVPGDLIRLDLENIVMEYVEREPVVSPIKLLDHVDPVLRALAKSRLRHGDLTEASIIIRDDTPVLVDWAESRHLVDPRPDKRREGDTYWLIYTLGHIALKAAHSSSVQDKVFERLEELTDKYGLQKRLQFPR